MFRWLRKLTLLLWLILCLQLFLGAHSVEEQFKDNANLLCTQLLNTKLLERCCGDSKPSELLFNRSKCEEFKDDLGPCRYQCIYKHFELLSPNHTLIMSNVSSMIQRLYGLDSGFHSYGLELLGAFENCQKLSSTYTGLMRMVSTLSDPEPTNLLNALKCNNKAMIYAKCTTANMFLNCPDQNWQIAIEDCAASRRLLQHCVRFLNGIDDVNSNQKRIHGRSASASSSKRELRSLKAPSHWYTAFFNWLVF